MRKIYKYTSFLLEKEFESITDEIFKILESDAVKTGDNTFTWDLKKEPKKVVDDEKPVTVEWDLKKEPKKVVDDEKPVTVEWDIKKDTKKGVDDEKPVTMEWDLSKPATKSVIDRLKSFLSKLPKEEIKKYFYKFLEKIKRLPSKIRRTIMINYATAFLSVASIAFLVSSTGSKEEVAVKDVVKEFVSVNKKSSFDVSQKLVSIAEGGYSDDKKDTGNWVEFELNGKKEKRFIGTKYGISAPVLMQYLGRLPKKEDMINLSYEDALQIYKGGYWDSQNIDTFSNQSVANTLYDSCVNQGIEGTKSVLRKAMNENGLSISDDENPFSVENIKKANVLDQESLFNSIQKFRELRYKDARTFKHHGAGWLNRLNKISFEETIIDKDIENDMEEFI